MFWRDREFQERLLALLAKDRKFLRKTAGLLTLEDFKSRDKSDVEAWAREKVGAIVLNYWSEFREPVAGMLRTEVLDFIRNDRKKLGQSQRDELLNLVSRLQDPELGTGVEAMERKIIRFKQRQRIKQSINLMLEAEEKGELTVQKFRKFTTDAMQGIEFNNPVIDYSSGLDERIERREKNRNLRYPSLMIPPLDQKIRTIPRGQLGLVLAKYKVGKSVMMAHLCQSYASQGFNSILFTLEDPKEIVEDRLDASLCGITLQNLVDKPRTLRKRFRERMEMMRAGIKIVDATGGGWTVERMAMQVDTIRNSGWIPDAIFIDYDEHIATAQKYSGESAIRMQSQEIYLSLTQWCARDLLYMWTAAQAKRLRDDKVVLTGEDTAEDISKIRKVGLAIGMGMAPQKLKLGDNGRYLQVMAHRFDKQRVGTPIVGDFAASVLVDQDATDEAVKRWESMSDDDKKNYTK